MFIKVRNGCFFFRFLYDICFIYRFWNSVLNLGIGSLGFLMVYVRFWESYFFFSIIICRRERLD